MNPSFVIFFLLFLFSFFFPPFSFFYYFLVSSFTFSLFSVFNFLSTLYTFLTLFFFFHTFFFHVFPYLIIFECSHLIRFLFGCSMYGPYIQEVSCLPQAPICPLLIDLTLLATSLFANSSAKYPFLLQNIKKKKKNTANVTAVRNWNILFTSIYPFCADR